ncbi:MAG: leucyl/phenylalanyl-tRNA--protein transferase [Treponema sp.]|nr:leucyl/phenylalanyl-tRNA--protein transferase [Treponema sp.]
MKKWSRYTHNFTPGPDPDFPYLDENTYFSFTDPEKWNDDIIAVGGNLSPGMLLSAYEQGIFPWYNPEDPIIWQSPDPRCVIFSGKLHVSASMRKIINTGVFEITIDRDFAGVIKSCAETKRRGQSGGTWITADIIEAYTELHRLSWAHSAEAWQDGQLAGGCYGVLMGKAFFGESMFSRRSNASKAAFLSLAEKLFNNGLAFIDCQVPTPHLTSLGGEEMSRKDFLELLKVYNISRKCAII